MADEPLDERQRVRTAALALAGLALLVAAVLIGLQIWYGVAGALLVLAGSGWWAARLYRELHEEAIARAAQSRARGAFVDPVPDIAPPAEPTRRTPF